MEMTTAKTIAVFAIIVGCFAVLYPKIFHPMLLHTFGTGDRRAGEDMLPKMPPHLRRPGGASRTMQQGEDLTQHMRGPGPHPGLRAAAEMKKQAATTQGSGKGMMSIVLPMYAVGIVIYLIYTLTKVFGKGSKTEDKDYVSSHFKGEEEKKKKPGPKETKRQQKDLERLLMKADKDKIYNQLLGSSKPRSKPRNTLGLGSFVGQKKQDVNSLSEFEMQELKKRLLETEAQMTRILQAMETVTEKVNIQSQDDDLQERPKKSANSSPDMDSYDVINKTFTSEEESPVEVENIGAKSGPVKSGMKSRNSRKVRIDKDNRDCESDKENSENCSEVVCNDDEDDYDEDEEDGVLGDTEEDSDDYEEEEEEEEYCEEKVIGQQESSEEEEVHPDLRKRTRPPSNQKHK